MFPMSKIRSITLILFCTAIGFYVLFTPYEKFREMFPAASKKWVIKLLGAVASLSGLAAIILQILSLIYFKH